jgi:hypothetical protein
LRAVGWAPEAIREIAFLAASHVYFNRIATLPAMPVARLERMARLPGLELVGLVHRWLSRARPRPEPLPREACGGPWSYLVEALSSLPVARGLRRVLDEACASPGLPRRTKLLVFAVIARTAACSHSGCAGSSSARSASSSGSSAPSRASRPRRSWSG